MQAVPLLTFDPVLIRTAGTMFLRLAAVAAFLHILLHGGSVAFRWDTFGYQVSLQQSNRTHFCSATIVNELWLLTTAHCCEYALGRLPEVTAFVAPLKLDREKPYQYNNPPRIRVLSVLIHPKYNRSGTAGNHDLCSVKLMERIDFSKCDGLPVVLAQEGEMPVPDRTAMSGYSALPPCQPGQCAIYNDIGITMVEHQPDSFCNTFVAQGKLVAFDAEFEMCAQPGIEAACYGISGGALMTSNKLFGILTRAERDCQPGPIVFARISKYLSWIQEVTTQT